MATIFKRTQADQLAFETEDAIYLRSSVSRILMRPDNAPISDVKTLKAKRDELFRNFVDHPGKLALAIEIKIIDDKIVELNVGKKKAK